MKTPLPADCTSTNSLSDATMASCSTDHRLALELEANLRQWLTELNTLVPPRSSRGAPPVVPALALWAGVLVSILRGEYNQLAVWRLLTQWGLWDFPLYEVVDMAIYNRLERMPPSAMEELFTLVSGAIRTHFPDPFQAPGLEAHGLEAMGYNTTAVNAIESGATAEPGAISLNRADPAYNRADPDWFPSFAAGIYALDGTVLDPLLRKLKMLRDVPSGDQKLLPGKIGALFELRRQQWERIRYFDNPMENDHNYAWSMVEGLPEQSLLLCDLGYFSFYWFDRLTDANYYYVSRMEERITYEPIQMLYESHSHSVSVRDQIVYLGQHRANRAAHPVRLLEVTIRTKNSARVHRYITNVLDPKLLSVRQIVELYRRRWDIEQMFNMVKTHLDLSILSSGHNNAVLIQVYATFTISQVFLAIRSEIARRTRVDVREVSLELLVRYTPRAMAEQRDIIEFCVNRGRKAGLIRPFRGKEYIIPPIRLEDYTPINTLPASRPPRYRRPDGGVLQTSTTLKNAQQPKDRQQTNSASKAA